MYNKVRMTLAKSVKALFEGKQKPVVRKPAYVLHSYRDPKSHNPNKTGLYRVYKPKGFSGATLREMRATNGVGRPPVPQHKG